MQPELEKFRQFKEGDLILVACALPCEWVIHSSSDPSTATYACSGHLEEMLDDSKEHHIFPHDGAYENAPINCCFILPTRQLPVSDKHPFQPKIVDKHGVLRSKANAIVRLLLDRGPITMNDLAVMNFSDEDRSQFAQLIGYSVSGYGELDYTGN